MPAGQDSVYGKLTFLLRSVNLLPEQDY